MHNPIPTVKSFLGDLARRDLAAAQKWLAPKFQLHIAGRSFDSLRGFAAFSKHRQKLSKKHLHHCDHCHDAAGNDVVYARGTMEGIWNDDATFTDIYWLDRFEFRGDLIHRLDIVSDMAEFRPSATQGAT